MIEHYALYLNKQNSDHTISRTKASASSKFTLKLSKKGIVRPLCPLYKTLYIVQKLYIGGRS